MGKRGPQPKRTINTKWSRELAYVVGLLVTDGNLSKDGRHMTFTSKDVEQIKTFKRVLGLKVKTGRSYSTISGSKKYCPRVQFGDIAFYEFLISIGLMPNKSKIIGEIKVPDKYFFDCLRGEFDGDGSFYSYWDKRWRSSFLFYLEFVTASKKHLNWVRKQIYAKLGVSGHVTKDGNKSTYQLKYAKNEAIKIIEKMYENTDVFLKRKKVKIYKAIKINTEMQKKYRML